MQLSLPATVVTASDLLNSVAEQLKLPLSNISRRTELARLTGEVSIADINTIHAQAQAALNLVDSYMLGLSIINNQEVLELEPVSVSSILIDTAHALSVYAKEYGVFLEIEIDGRYEPVVGNKIGLKAALSSLGYELISNQAAHTRSAHLTFAATKTKKGIITGIYSDYEALQSANWKKALELCGKARQPFAQLTAGTGAGIFVADTILQAMSSRLSVGKYKKQKGLACALQPSQQMQLV
jgi:signal transduction histidine kinase